jgi:membrane-bound lytic murein transglycosylase B
MIQKGVKKYQDLQDTLAIIHKKYKIPPQYLLAIWGVESRYGSHTNKYRVLPALVTLAYGHPRSRNYFRRQLIVFLEIHQTHEKLPVNLKGSWAGAMGQPQFLPTSYLEYAVDFTGNGWADIWNSEADILASIANYVSQHGWDPKLSWGRRLKPGEKLIPGYKLITTGDSEVMRFAVTDNFHAVFSYNHSNHYTLTVCQLADALDQKIKKIKK